MELVIIVIVSQKFSGLFEVADLRLVVELLPQHVEEQPDVLVLQVEEGVVHLHVEVPLVLLALDVGEGRLDVTVYLLELGFGSGEGEQVLGMVVVDAVGFFEGLTLSH